MQSVLVDDLQSIEASTLIYEIARIDNEKEFEFTGAYTPLCMVKQV